MTFSLDSLPTPSEISGAINYLLSNLTPGLVSNQSTGEVTQDGNIVSYIYKYIAVKYADSADGGTNFSDSPTGRLYYGTNNSNSANESTNPADYLWKLVAGGGFGSTKYLWYQTTGGRQINFEVNTQRPNVGWVSVNTAAIDLDVISNSEITGQNFNAYFQPSSLQVTTVSGTPIFTNVIPQMFAVSGSNVAIFVNSQTDADSQFENNTWRIGGSSTTGNADIVYTNITIGSPYNAGGWAAWPAPTAMASSPASIAVPTRYKDRYGNVYQGAVITQSLVFVAQPTTGSKTQTAYLYQWTTSFPTNPSGVATYTWASNTLSSYTGGGGWTTTLPANPGITFIKLYIAAKPVTDVVGATTTTVSWSSGYSIYDSTSANIPGFQSAQPTVYQYGLSIPSISGTSTYTWSTGGFTAPAGWTTSITGTPSPGYTLYAATVTLVDATTASVSVINWSTSSIVAAGYAGSTGASSRIMYARIPANPTPTSGLVTVTGDNRPTGAQAGAVWNSSFNVTWYATDPTPSSSDSLYQSDGVYDSVANNTVWSTPYISSLKVGSLSAITVNTGALTVTGDFKAGNIVRSGATVGSGSGAIIEGNTGYFALGNTTGSVVYNGTNVALNGTVLMQSLIASNTASGGYLNILNTNNILQVTRTTATSLPAYYIYDSSTTSGGVPAFTVLDTSSSNATNLVTFVGYGASEITLEVSSNGSSSGAAKFFNNYASKQFWAAPGSYSAYSPSGGGKIYIVDGNGPFTGFHDTLIPINTTVETGDILVDTQLIYKADVNTTLFEVALSSQPSQSSAIGIASSVVSVAEGTPAALWISTIVPTEFGAQTTWQMQPGFDPAVIEATYKVVQVNALGEGQINVCGENGNIARGDLIVTSSIVGKGMKQSDNMVRSISVAKARESATFSDPTEVKQIACIYLCG